MDHQVGIKSSFSIRFYWVWVFLFFIGIGMGIPQVAQAHAVLLEAVPSMNEELARSPHTIILTFNEPLDRSGYNLQLFRADQKLVELPKPTLDASGTKLMVEPGQLSKGIYWLTYKVISADGHLVDGTYMFAIGQRLDVGLGTATSPAQAHMSSGHDHLTKLDEVSRYTTVQLIVRWIQYVGLVFVTGLVVWSRWLDISRERYLQIRRRMVVPILQGYIVIYLVAMFLHLYEAIEGKVGIELDAQLFTSTFFLQWFVGLLVAFSGLWIVAREGIALELLWLLAIWGTKSWNGHAGAYADVTQSLLLDLVHLAATSVWMGGLFLWVWAWWRKLPERDQWYRPISSRLLMAMLFLVLTGTILTFLYIPAIDYLLQTSWGKLLLLKMVLLVLVIATGGVIRWIWNKKDRQTVRYLLVIDMGLALTILAIVSIFTCLSPLPSREPFRWHVMGEQMHMTAQIIPAVPGVNEFKLRVWMPVAEGAPKAAILRLRNKQLPDMAPIDLPIERVEDGISDEAFGGVSPFSYSTKGPYIPVHGQWELEVRVMSALDHETVLRKQFMIY